MENSLIQITENLSVVISPIDAYDIRFKTMPDDTKELVGTIKDEDGNVGTCNFKVQGDYKLLGTITASEIDFDCCELVDIDEHSAGWRDYTNINRILPNPSDSFYSLLTSKSAYWENPMGDEQPMPPKSKTTGRIANYLTQRDKWQQAEQQKLQLNQKLIAIWKV